MTAINLSNVSVYRWAEKRKVFLPVDFRKTPEREAMFLKMLYMRHVFVKLPPVEHQTRMAELVQEAMKCSPVSGLGDRAVVVIQIAGAIFFAVLFLRDLTSSKL